MQPFPFYSNHSKQDLNRCLLHGRQRGNKDVKNVLRYSKNANIIHNAYHSFQKQTETYIFLRLGDILNVHFTFVIILLHHEYCEILKCPYYVILNIAFHAVCNVAVRECKQSAEVEKPKVHDK